MEPLKTPAFVIETENESETQAVGARLGGLLKPGDSVGLEGGLGAGKTVFVRGVGQGLHCAGAVTSPTFALAQTHKGGAGRCALNHVDLYRLEPKDVPSLDWDELFSDRAVTVVEWAEKARGVWPADCLWVRLAHAGGDKRRLEFHPLGKRAAEVVKKMKEKA
ncbi:MAG: tRNA (adenosine(37)-N6)-threonylcarbamoyltransferase complex ATPase subunit type 1 TsaE [Elusimicrobiota bacterium]